MLAKDLNRHFSKDTIQMAGLTGEARLIGHLSTKQKAASSVPSQGTCLGCGLVPSWGARKRQPVDVSLSHIDASLPLFLPPFPSL